MNNPVFIIFFVITIFFVTIFCLMYKDQRQPSSSQSLITKSIRQPAAAGTFYPSDKNALDTELSKLIATASGQASTSARIIIAPHAGIDYSGPVAAAAFAKIDRQKINKVILLGPSHHHVFDYAAVSSSDIWQTPLGQISLDKDLISTLLSPSQKIVIDDSVHADEHSLEMEVIYLQKILPNFQIVPILLSNPSDELIAALAFRIAQNLDDHTLVIVSSDLSHYETYTTANQLDKQTITAILSNQSSNLENLVNPACGVVAIRVALSLSNLIHLTPSLIKYANSGDTSIDKSRVVGYSAIVFSGPNLDIHIPSLSKTAQKEALNIATSALRNIPATSAADPVLKLPLGAFVTLRNKGQLRGCIGEFSPDKPLYKVIADSAIKAATQDPRFPPVSAEELPDISLEISVMTPQHLISDWRSIRLGVDGVVLTQGAHSGTFLPQVATDSGWPLTTFLEELCSQKAGLPKSCYLDPSTKIYTFQAQVF
jgi:MEMO1 family protein